MVRTSEGFAPRRASQGAVVPRLGVYCPIKCPAPSCRAVAWEVEVKRSAISSCMLAASLLLWSRAPAHAQAVANAQIHGVITDTSGAVISGAEVKATQAETGQARSAQSASDGS